jgi:quercetin dioxygenase-like cupin family protein
MENTSEKFKQDLYKEGFKTVFVWEDRPNAKYSAHTHPCKTVHIVLKGSITITSEGEVKTCRPFERFDVEANTIHSALIGSEGCTYIIGEFD